MRSFLKKRAQSSLELAVILSILLLFTVSIFAFIQVRMTSAIKERNDYLVQSLGSIITTEVNLASSVDGDYYREFTLPFAVEGKNYSIEKNGASDIVLIIEDSSSVIFLNSDVSGNFLQGNNIIRKTNGIISVNS